ncbi:NADH-cytochrome b5 reductase [Collybia nuda]|uniref:NADH-cytochrome b5 reductase n=1 Tax=Collybia nuda TaxID=64659 RepID=A0A9P6CC60_9AGAR|nr:NADH-cytochrome b5 reductase [Collybia nuda]
MPNRFQLAFLASLLLTFFSLVLLSRFVNSKLIAAGYDISHIILIGLPKEGRAPDRFDMADITLPFIGQVDLQKLPSQVIDTLKNLQLDDFRAVEVPYVGTYDLVTLAGSPAVVVTGLIIVATAFYSKVLHTGRTKPLNPNAWQEYPLEKKIKVSPNTAIYRFTLPHAQDVLGLPVGQHISVSAEINGKEIVRSYTPVSNDDDRGHFDLLIKTYEKGNISRHISLLKIGDNLRVKGPKGNFHYSPGLTSHISMIAGGTGITPMIQIIRAALRNPFDPTTISLIYANVNEEDILLKDDLEELLDVHELKFKIFYVLNNPPPGWKGGVGFVTKEHIKEYFPNPNTTDSKILICGPPPMVSAMKKNLEDLKYPAPRTVSKLADQVFVF